MNFTVDIQNESNYPLNRNHLIHAARMVLLQQTVQSGSGLTVVIAADDFVRSLNRQFRGIDAPTDVLSFPADPPPIVMEEEPPYLGDLIIAYPYAAAQAEQAAHTLNDSLALLVVHGILHLLGYDHDTPENRVVMWAAQESALLALGISVEIVPTLEESMH